MQTKRRKVLWFCWGPPDEATKEKAVAAGAMIRDASAYHEGDFVEQCDEVMGEHIPAAYTAQLKTHEMQRPPFYPDGLSGGDTAAATEDQPATSSRQRAK